MKQRSSTQTSLEEPLVNMLTLVLILRVRKTGIPSDEFI